MTRSVLAIGAHLDDIELGVGGTLIQHIKEGDKVIALVCSLSGYANTEGKVVRDNDIAVKEGKEAMKILGVNNLIILDFEELFISDNDELVISILKIVEKENPDIVYCPWHADTHRDHRNVAKAAIMATKHVPNLLMYSINWYESYQHFSPSIFSDITSTYEQKKKALEAHKSELKRVDYIWIRFIDSMAQFYGLKAGVVRAEGFVAIKLRYPFPTV